MKLFNDTRIYFWSAIVMFAVFVILAAVSFYSILHVESKAVRLLSEGNDYYVSASAEKSEDAKKALAVKYSDKFKEAYILLRSPEVFARYENFDRSESRGDMLKKVISYFDSVIAQNGHISVQDELYIESLLERRKLGSRLGRNTAFFFLFLSLLGWGFWWYEKKSMKKAR